MLQTDAGALGVRDVTSWYRSGERTWDLGPILARGRAADVYAFGDGHVLRRYRSDHDTAHEAAVMDHVRRHGYPAPEVVEASGRDLVMERLEGDTMLSDLARRPWRLRSQARTLARLLKGLHALPVPPGLTPRHARTTAIVHLDLHPDNVVLTPRGPVVIDWTNAGAGDPSVELADLWALFTCAEPPSSGRREQIVTRLGRRGFCALLLAHFDREVVRRGLREAVEGRLADPNMAPREREAMGRMAARERV
jgi:aminoglycoside phosphotransferase (APT) family kinase protein